MVRFSMVWGLIAVVALAPFNQSSSDRINAILRKGFENPIIFVVFSIDALHRCRLSWQAMYPEGTCGALGLLFCCPARMRRCSVLRCV